jgi:carboxypeptidase PM20D1
MPPRETAVGILARALDRIERHPMPQRFDGPLRDMFLTLAPEMSPGLRIAFANAWLTKPLLLRQLAATPQSNALTRTTIAPTELEGSSKANVLATRARAGLNVRLLPGDSADDVIAHLTRVVADARVRFAVAPEGWAPASRVSDAASPEFQRMSQAIRAVYPNTLVAPIVSVGASDARQYEEIATTAFRFLPIDQPGALELFHGPNEHIQIDVYEKAIRTYATIIRELGRAPDAVSPATGARTR